MSANERIKVESKGLFFVADKAGTHTFRDEIDALDRGEPTISGTAKELSKFFGIYKQQARGERGKKTDDYFFMVRIKHPGRRPALAARSGWRSTTRPTSSPTARSASRRARASSTTTSTARSSRR